MSNGDESTNSTLSESSSALSSSSSDDSSDYECRCGEKHAWLVTNDPKLTDKQIALVLVRVNEKPYVIRPDCYDRGFWTSLSNEIVFRTCDGDHGRGLARKVREHISWEQIALRPLRVLVSGAASSKTGRSLVPMIAQGIAFGMQTPITLVLHDIPAMAAALAGMQVQLKNGAFENLKDIELLTDEKDASMKIDFAFLVGAVPRESMDSKAPLAAHVRIFEMYGKVLADHANPTTKVLVVGDYANTGAFICAKYASSKIPARNFSAMIRLDHNCAKAQIAQKAGVSVAAVKNVVVWGSHFPDASHARVSKGEADREVSAYEAVGDNAYLQGEFISYVQKSGAINAEECLIPLAAKATCEHMRDWIKGTAPDEFVSMAVPSDGSYGVTEGLFFSFPVKIAGGEWEIVQGLALDDFAKGNIALMTKELEGERDDALAACADANQ